MAKKRESAEELSVGEVASRAGVAVSALHFYESKGLILSRRNGANQRRYSRAVLRMVSIIKVAQSLGFSLGEIKGMLSGLSKTSVNTEKEWRGLARTWRRDLDARIERLTLLRDRLDGCIGCGCLATRVCPLRNPEDRLAGQGPGAHLW